MNSLPLIAIHHRAGSFSERWIKLCRESGQPFRLVDATLSDIVKQCSECDIFMWHYDHEDRFLTEQAEAILAALESAGILVFPDYRTRWHFDDKLAQKYLFESLKIPHMKTTVFLSEMRAEEALRDLRYPIVWKLRRGAGSANVGLLRSTHEAARFFRQMFTTGRRTVSGYFEDSSTRLRSIKSLGEALAKLRRAPSAILRRRSLRGSSAAERGYVLLQEFAPNNQSDTRVTVIGDRAWAFRRRVRPGDFRASGSRSIDYEPSLIDPRCIRAAFEAMAMIRAQCLAFDFVHDAAGEPMLVECSFGFLPSAVASAPGQFDSAGEWIAGARPAEDAQIEVLLKSWSDDRSNRGIQ